MPDDTADLQEAIENQFLTAMGRAGRLIETSAFRLHLWDRAHPFYRNAATPIRRPREWRAAVAEMFAAFAAANRPPRLEFLEERWPDLGAAVPGHLPLAGRLPVLVATAAPTTRASPAPIVQLEATVAAADLSTYLAAVNDAFAVPVEALALTAESEQLRQEIASGRCRVAVALAESGGIVAGASLIGIGIGLGAELAGVWTSPERRGHGLARAVCGHLMTRFFSTGGRLVWLAAEDRAALATYERLGFRRIGHQTTYCGSHSRTSP